jgi:hypothetical protein
MMPVPKVMLSSLIDKAISIAKNNGIQNIEPYREEIIKQAAALLDFIIISHIKSSHFLILLFIIV